MKHQVTDDGRWVLGDKNVRCRHCNHEAAVHYAENGRAELWHAPTDCCAYSRAREVTFGGMARRDERAAWEQDQRAKPRATEEMAA